MKKVNTKAPKVKNSNPSGPYMREADDNKGTSKKSAQWPMKKKTLSK